MLSEVPGNFEFEWKVENVFAGSETLDSPIFRIGFLDQSTWFIRLLPSRNRCEWHRYENHVIRKGRTFKISIQFQIKQFNSGAILEEWSNPELNIDSETSHVFFEEAYAKEQHPPSPQIETWTVLFLVQDLTASHENSSTRFIGNNTPQILSSSLAESSLSWTDNYDRPSSFLPSSSRCFSRADIMQKTVNWTMDKMGHGERRVLYLEPSIRNAISALQLSATNESGKLHLGVEKTDCHQTASVLRVVAEWDANPEYFKVSCRFDEQRTAYRFDTGIQLNSIKDDSFLLKLDIKEVIKDGGCHPNKRTRFLTRRPSSGANVTREIVGEDMLKMYRDKMGIDVELRASCGKVFGGHRDFLVSRSPKFKALLLQADELHQKEALSGSLEENNNVSHVPPEEREIVENGAENKWVAKKNQNILKSNAIGTEKDELENLTFLKMGENRLDVVQELSDDSVEVYALESPSKVPQTNFKRGKGLSKNSKANQGYSSLKENCPKGVESETFERDPDTLLSGNEGVSNASYVQELKMEQHEMNFMTTVKMCDNIDTLHTVTTNYSPDDCTLGENKMTCSPRDFKRNWDSESKILDILDLDAETLNYLLIFLYSASLEEELELHTLSKIYEAAYLYHVPDLQDLCRGRLERVLDKKIAAKDILCQANKYEDI